MKFKLWKSLKGNKESKKKNTQQSLKIKTFNLEDSKYFSIDLHKSLALRRNGKDIISKISIKQSLSRQKLMP